MSDGSTAASAISAYTRVYEEEQPRLVAYARSLTGNAWVAEDLVAEAHFRVWRRLSAGHEVDNVPAYLMTTVRHLAATVGSAARELPLDPLTAERVEVSVTAEDPAERVSSVDLLNRVLGQLPQRWVKALWLAEAEGVPLEDIGRRIGAKRGATAVLLHRAREGMRQAFLRAHPGTPSDPACEAHWDRMPAYVREAATPRQSEHLLAHLDDCADCRARLAALMQANDRLPALVGPALLIFVLGGSGKFLLPLAAGSTAGAGGHGSGLLHAVRHVVTGGSKVPGAAMTAIGATAAGAAVAAGIVLSSAGESTPVPQQRVATVAQTPGAAQEAGPAQEGGAEARGSEDADDTGPAAEAPAPAAASPAAPGTAASEEATPQPEATTTGEAASEEAATPPEAPTPEATASEPEPTASETTPEATPTEATPTPAPTPTVAAPTPTPTPTPTPVIPTPTPVVPTPEPVTPTPTFSATPVDPTPEPTVDAPVCEPWHGPIYICYTS